MASQTKGGGTGDHLAILIDADNVSSKHIVGLMAEVANYGTPSVKRIYGDWTQPSMKSWRECLLEHSIVPIQQFAYTTGKNATDGAMIIDAMDLMYTGRFSSFCLVSSDSDFTRLAARIREQGIYVYGFGNRHNTHRAFVAACNEFVYFDALSIQADEPNEPVLPPLRTPTKLPLGNASTQAHEPHISRPPPPMGPMGGVSLSMRPLSRIEPAQRPLDQAALDGIRQAISNCSIYEEDYVNLAEVGNYLVKLSPDLKPRNYGFDKLREFIMASGIVDSKMKSRNPAPPIALVRLKE